MLPMKRNKLLIFVCLLCIYQVFSFRLGLELVRYDRASFKTVAPWRLESHLPRAMCTSDDVENVVERCKTKIMDKLKVDSLENVKVRSDNTDPNGMHLKIEVVSPLFKGKRSMQRHQLVYKAIWDEMSDRGPIHAIDSIVANTPEEL